MHVLTKGQVFGQVNYWHYSIEWQNRGLPHVHILIRLLQCINQNYFDEIMSAEIPNPQKTSQILSWKQLSVIRGPEKGYGVFNPVYIEIYSQIRTHSIPHEMRMPFPCVAMDMEIRQ